MQVVVVLMYGQSMYSTTDKVKNGLLLIIRQEAV